MVSKATDRSSKDRCTTFTPPLPEIIQKCNQCYFCPISWPEVQMKGIQIICFIPRSLKLLCYHLLNRLSSKWILDTGWKLSSIVGVQWWLLEVGCVCVWKKASLTGKGTIPYLKEALTIARTHSHASPLPTRLCLSTMRSVYLKQQMAHNPRNPIYFLMSSWSNYSQITGQDSSLSIPTRPATKSVSKWEEIRALLSNRCWENSSACPCKRFFEPSIPRSPEIGPWE